MNKSMFMASKNMKTEEMIKIEEKLGIKRTESLGSYLGMPSQVGRGQRVVFMKLRDRVKKILQGWKENLFSLGGKEVLIKSVAQAIPIYTMSCFRILILSVMRSIGYVPGFGGDQWGERPKSIG